MPHSTWGASGHGGQIAQRAWIQPTLPDQVAGDSDASGTITFAGSIPAGTGSVTLILPNVINGFESGSIKVVLPLSAG